MRKKATNPNSPETPTTPNDPNNSSTLHTINSGNDGESENTNPKTKVGLNIDTTKLSDLARVLYLNHRTNKATNDILNAE